MGLSALQVRVAKSFFALPESDGFVLAGGGALIVQRLVDRTTKDLDLFGREEGLVLRAADALQRALTDEGLSSTVVRRFAGFAQLQIRDGEDEARVDVGHDYQWREPVITDVGPARAPTELAVDKLLALFGRALPRDFVDVYFLAQRHGIENMLRWAPEKDAGFSPYFLAEGLGMMVQLPRERFEVDDATFDDMSEFYADLRAELIRRTVEDS